MATLSITQPTLLDFANREDPDGNIAKVVEILQEENEILEHMPFIEGNLTTGHLTTVRSGLPSGTWRQLNYGVPPEKSTTVQVTDSCGMLESYAEVDKKLADLNGNADDFRHDEDTAFIQGMANTMAVTLFYGDTSDDPEKFMGLSPRYSELTGAGNSDNVLGGGGTGDDNQSIWLVVWGPQSIHGIFPKGLKAGLEMENLGQVTLTDDAGGRYEGYRTHYSWDIGLTLRDWRQVVRICNIDTSLLTIDYNTGANLTDLMIQATETVHKIGRGNAQFYCTKTVRSMLRRQIIEKTNVNLTYDSVAGKRVLAFDGIPVSAVDALTATEPTLT